MPNVVIVASNPQSLLNRISKIVADLGIDITEGVITYGDGVYALRCVAMSDVRQLAPYLIVRDTNEQEGMCIAAALNEKLDMDVELEVIRAFFPHKPILAQ